MSSSSVRSSSSSPDNSPLLSIVCNVELDETAVGNSVVCEVAEMSPSVAGEVVGCLEISSGNADAAEVETLREVVADAVEYKIGLFVNGDGLAVTLIVGLDSTMMELDSEWRTASVVESLVGISFSSRGLLSV